MVIMGVFRLSTFIKNNNIIKHPCNLEDEARKSTENEKILIIDFASLLGSINRFSQSPTHMGYDENILRINQELEKLIQTFNDHGIVPYW